LDAGRCFVGRRASCVAVVRAVLVGVMAVTLAGSWGSERAQSCCALR